MTMRAPYVVAEVLAICPNTKGATLATLPNVSAALDAATTAARLADGRSVAGVAVLDAAGRRVALIAAGAAFAAPN
jgi:hypothetical protein